MTIKKILLSICEVGVLGIMMIYVGVLMYWTTLVLSNFPHGSIPSSSAPLGFVIALCGFMALCKGNDIFVNWVDVQK